MLAIDLFSADCFFQASKTAKSEQVARYFADLARLYQHNGIETLEIFLDKNPTHKGKMESLFADLAAELTIKVKFHLMAGYSPKLNLVEYAIHLIRQKVLHHADSRNSLDQFESSIKEICDKKKIFTKEQIVNVLAYIESLVPAPEFANL